MDDARLKEKIRLQELSAAGRRLSFERGELEGPVPVADTGSRPPSDDVATDGQPAVEA